MPELGQHPERLGDRALGAATSSRGVYVYGVIAADDAELPVQHEGIAAGAPVNSIVEGGLAAVSCAVPLSEFGEEELRAHLTDMVWVERVARSHEAVLDELSRWATVVPMRMCTVYLTEASLREMLRRESRRLEAALAELDGKLEWGVRLVLAGGQPAATTRAERSSAQDAAQASTGTDYLNRRRAQRTLEAEQEDRLSAAGAVVHETLLSVAVDGRLMAPHAGSAAGTVSNGVYLVQRVRSQDFHSEVDRLRAQLGEAGLELVETGPWPPYNFVPGTL